MKNIILGIDGASFELIDSWIKKGNLPNLMEIREKGAHGNLKAQLPPVTTPNWKCYSTGKNPGKLGIFWWENIDWSRRKVISPDYRSKENKEIWDYLNLEEHKVAVINIPASFPPKKIDGYLVSGGPDAGDDDYFYPPSLEKDIKDINYKVRPKKSISNASDCRDCFDEIVSLIGSRFDLADRIIEDDEVDFVHLTIFFINVLHHFLWDDDLVKKAWGTIDENIGNLLEKYREEYNILVMSDHGSNRIDSVFNINSWLEKEGYLKRRNNFLISLFSKVGLTRQNVIDLSEALRMKNLLLKIMTDSMKSSIPTKRGGINREAKGRMVDWEESKALASGQGPLYINKEKLGENYEKFRKELIEKLEKLKSPLSDEEIIRKVYEREEIYEGKYLDKAPDLIVDQAPHTHIPGEVGKEKVFEKPGKWKGENKRTGLFAAIGPEIKEGEKVDISILDIAPTILHLYGVSVPEKMDGKVLTEIFREGSEPAKRKVSYEKETPEKERAKTKISELKESRRI